MAVVKGAIRPWQAEQALRVPRLEMAMDLVRWTPEEEGHMILTVVSHNVNQVGLHLQLMLRCGTYWSKSVQFPSPSIHLVIWSMLFSTIQIFRKYQKQFAFTYWGKQYVTALYL